jgi:ferredoxin
MGGARVNTLCAKLAPKVFEIKDDTAVLKETDSLHPGVKMAENKCPEKAICINR